MGFDAIHSIEELTRKVTFPDNVDFRDTNTPGEVITERLCNAAMYFNIVAITDYGGKPGGVRESGRVEQIIGSPFQTFGGEEMTSDPIEKAARLFRGLIQGHPFNDANKRTGFLTTAYYLQKMGYYFPDQVDIDSLYEFCLDVSSGRVKEIEEIVSKIKKFWIIA